MTPLDIAAPLASLRALLPGVSHEALGAAREPPVSKPAVIHAEQARGRISVEKLAAYAAGAGFRLVLGVEPAESTEHQK